MQTSVARRVDVSGHVQGVGFRPFVYRLASSLGLQGSVCNQSCGVRIELQGSEQEIATFLEQLPRQAPGEIERIKVCQAESLAYDNFTISASESGAGLADALLMDRGICDDCLHEFNDPANRRFQYPFINCTACGPRFSVSRRMPYDRVNTAWHDFPLCEACQQEYESPADRRFHAVGISCPACGPELYTPDHVNEPAAIENALATLEAGGVLALKGPAGFQLLVDANNPDAVERLRLRKRRRKSFAVMAPDLEWVEANASISGVEKDVLLGPARPLVLLQSYSEVAQTVAPGTRMLAVMLPCSGMHLRLVQALGRPLVTTSGNLSGSALIFDNAEALVGLAEIADCFLLHDLNLAQGLDDSIVRVMGEQAVTLRMARGIAPQSFSLPLSNTGTEASLGCGAHLKSSLTLHSANKLIVGPYVGDLDSSPARARYREQKRWLPAYFQAAADGLEEVTDLHPDYGSTIEASYRAHTVPHHIAHAMAAWLENRPEPPFLVLAWDGTGLGPDGSIWGGECLRFHARMQWQRVGSVLPFELPRGDAIARYPGKIAQVLAGEVRVGSGLQCSSMGRLIEGMAAAAGLRIVNEFEAQCAIEWEALAWQGERGIVMDFALEQNLLDWRPLLPVIADHSLPLAERALGFHQALARAAVAQCQQQNLSTVLLSGGVFQNRLLVELILKQAARAKLQVGLHHRIPPNDGGISIGQCVALAQSVSEIQSESDMVEQCA